MILIDTSILVDVLRGGNIENAELLLMLVGTEEMAFARFTELEVLMGARDKRDWDSIRAFFKKRVLLDPQPETWSKASRIYFDLRRNGRTLRSSADCCIAQIALEHDLVLVHNDRDFEPVAEVVPLRLLRLKLRPANQKKNLP
jgi:predicted nucleic acid-binding protein